jgi:diguanylate cyclase (GGDEF)-like protein
MLRMKFLKAMPSAFAIPTDKPELMIAQAEAFSRQVPIMYLVVLVNACALAVTHLHSTPPLLTLGALGALFVVSVIRILAWWRARDQEMTPARAEKLLKSTMVAAAILGVGFASWSLALTPYGDGFEKTHVAFFMAITVIACIFCLMNLRTAALIITACVIVPMIAYFGLSGQLVFQAIAVNVVIVAAAMIRILLTHYKEFADLVESRRALILKARQAQILGEENHRLANLDSLTQLPNRRRFFSELDGRLADAVAGGPGFLVGVLDLDGFKPVNDAFGHATGDRLLVEVGRRLSSFTASAISVARLGGDEFGLITETAMTAEEAAAFGKALCHVLRQPYHLPGVIAQVTGSIGLCPWSEGDGDAEKLFERADYALYFAKDNAKGTAVLFDAQHEAAIRELSRVEQALRAADLNAELHLAFQPIVDITQGRPIAFEALARWSSPELGEVTPDVFIRAAERSGQITEVTQVILRKALRYAAAWPMDIGLSVNLSARDIASKESVERITQIVRESAVAPHRIDFEITETAIVCDFDQARAALQALHELGAQTALDDFGTGHSSLTHVRLLPLDRLKVDASFIADIMDHRPSEDIVKTVLELCRNLRVSCVAEGVETEAQQRKVADLGGVLMQGFYYSRPIAAEAVADYLIQTNRAAMPVSAAPPIPSDQRIAS